MKSVSDWAQEFDLNAKPWLMLGKGPSFAHFATVPRDDFHLLTLNHVIRETPATLAHMIDLDVAVDCAESLLANASWVVMPWHPHVKFKSSAQTLADFVKEVPVLRTLDAENRLLFYNLSKGTKHGAHAGSPIVQARFFSAEAGLDLLATIGVRTVRSLGIDGGTAYGNAFADISKKTRLANGQSSFDRQFAGIANTIRRSEIFYAPLHVQAPVRVFVGADPTQALAYRVLDYSIRRHSSLSVETCVIDNSGLPIPTDTERRARTGFSFSRLKIPSLCAYQGRAIYMDADMQVFADILDLWNRPFGEADLLYAEHRGEGKRIPQFSVMLLNCATLDWDAKSLIERLAREEFTYKEVMHDFAFMGTERKQPLLPEEWNSLEHYEPGKTKLLHYTDMPTQPWVTNSNPFSQIWYDDLKRGIDEDFIPRALLYDEVERGHVSPNLPRWAGLPNPPKLKSLRRRFNPPHRRFARDKSAVRAAVASDTNPRDIFQRFAKKMNIARKGLPAFLANFLSRR